jgi:hypothetical protein
MRVLRPEAGEVRVDEITALARLSIRRSGGEGGGDRRDQDCP